MSTKKFVIKKKAKTGEKKQKEKPIQVAAQIAPELKEEVFSGPPGKMKICVIGPGAIGGLVSAYLKSKLRNIFVVGKLEQLRAIRMNGLRVEGVGGSLYVDLVAKEKLEQKPDLVILAVKTQDIREVIDKNYAFLKDTLILTTQNGVRADKIVSTALGEKNIISSIVMFGATYLKPGFITYNFEGNWIIGRPFSANDEKVKEVEYEISPAFKTVIADDITAMKWTKLFINFNNCIPALVGRSMQETFADLDMAKLSILLLKEGFLVVDTSHIKLANLPDFDLDKFRALTQMPLEQAAQIFSGIMTNLSKEPLFGSILQSIKRGRPSEIDYINGEIVNLSRFGSVGAELNSRAVRLVHEVEKKKKFFSPEQIKQEFRLEELK